MNVGLKNQIAIAVAAAIGASAMAAVPTVATAKTPGQYVAGDVHNHTTCSDGSTSMQKLVRKSTGKADGEWGLDWFVQAGHGGSGNRNCTLVEDATLATPAYPYLTGPTPFNTATGTNPPTQYTGPTTSWAASIGAANLKGLNGGVGGNGNMWRWQSVQEYQYSVLEYLAIAKNTPLFIGVETNNPGHEHTSMSVIDGQMPRSIDTATLPTTPGYNPLGNANMLAQWEYCFDRNDGDTSRGAQNQWDCSVPGSANAADPSWVAAAAKLIPSGTGVGTKGHLKSLEGLKWMATYAGNTSYFLPTHLERAGPFNPDGNNGFNIEHLRNFNNVAPNIAFGFETQPGHGASSDRGEYAVERNSINGVRTDSVGGTTYGGTGVYGAVVGGVWDALLGEGRNYWFFASSDWHNRGSFGADDRRTTQDFLPGEYQRAYSLVRNGTDKLRPQSIVDAMRSGNSWSSSGQIVDRVAFVACVSYPGITARSNAAVEALAAAAATQNTDIDSSGCATMGEKLKVRAGGEIVVSVVVRDPAGTNYSPYTFANPSLLQVGITQPLNQPVLDHIDLIQGKVTGYKTSGAPDYAGEWPRNTNWLRADGTTAGLDVVPEAAKNTSAKVIRTFNSAGWTPFNSSVDGTQFLKMTYRIPAVKDSQYVRLRGTNLPASVPFETDSQGNPLADVYTNASNRKRLQIPCTIPHSANSQFDGCPDHLATVEAGGPSTLTPGTRAVSYDVAAWADLWFYANPIYIEVAGSTLVAGVK